MQWFSWMILAAIVCSPSFSRVYPIAQATALLAGIAWDVRNETAGARPAGLTFALGGGTVQYHNARSEPVPVQFAAVRSDGRLTAGSPHSSAIAAANSLISATHRSNRRRARRADR